MSVIVMAKAVVAGAVKTRLIPHLGAQGAARLHAALTEHALRLARQAAVGPVFLAFAVDAHGQAGEILANLARQYGALLLPQGDGDLGQRMQRVFAATLDQGPAVMIGADCPTLSALDLRAAYECVEVDGRPTVALMAAEDGGYVLIAMKYLVNAAFASIPWSTAAVLDRTCDALRDADVPLTCLGTRYDVDREDDYQRMCQDAALPGWVDCSRTGTARAA
jgi:uncharacterized protein